MGKSFNIDQDYVQKLGRLLLIVLFLAVAVLDHLFVEPKLATFVGYLGFIPWLLFQPKSKQMIRFLYPLLAAFGVGLLFSFRNNLSDILRDVFYFLNPVIFMLLGTLYARQMTLKSFLLLIIYAGTFISLIYVLRTILLFGFSAIDLQQEVRSVVGVGNTVTVLALLMLIFAGKYTLLETVQLSRWRYPMLGVNALALVFFGSRTYTGIFLLGLIAFAFPFLQRNFRRYAALGVVVVLMIIVLLTVSKDNFMVSKMLNSVSEVSVSSNAELDESYENYRGFETFMAIQTYLDGNVLEKITGAGLGKLIDLKIYVELVGTERRFIPVLHSGYAYILVKTGIVGILLFLLFLANVFKLVRKHQVQARLLGMMTITTVLALYFATFIVSGWFNMEFLLTILILGGFIYYLQEHEQAV